MKRFLSLSLGLILVTSASVVLAGSSNSVDGDFSDYDIAVSGENTVLTSSTSSLNYKATVGTDTFCLYGGPGSDDGKFQDVNGVLPDRQGWYGIDLTDLPVFWQHSQFNVANLDIATPNNYGMWCGQDGTTQPSIGWVNTPGYGNNWFAILKYTSGPLTNSVDGQTVALDFNFNHDTEPGYDYFYVQYDSAGSFTEVFAADGSNRDTSDVFQAPGVVYSAAGATSIVYEDNSYGGDASDEIVIRMVVQSDGAWSDEDGLWPTVGGAASVDNIKVDHNENAVGGVTETFDGVAPYLWFPDKAPWVGDFSQVFARMGDADPCTEDLSPLMTFLDNDRPPLNSPGLNGDVSTGGTSSLSGSYGVPGNYVINFNGGLSDGELAIANEAWSPEIDWDIVPGVQGTPDEDPDVAGAFIRFSVWQDLPLSNGMFYVWHVRSTTDGNAWSAMQDRNFVYYGGGVALWANRQINVSDLIRISPLKVQMGMGVTDLAAAFAFPGDDATPSPAFDNAGFFKYKISGPTFAARAIDLYQDGFPTNGSIDLGGVGGPGALNIPMDMARDINAQFDTNNPGDSIIVDVLSVIPGLTGVIDSLNVRMYWHLERNPVFDTVRTTPTLSVPANAAYQNDAVVGSAWTGEVVAQQAFTSGGGSIAGRFFFELPDADFLYPGDVLNYYISATDDGGRTSTLPGNISGFGTPAYNRTYTVRGLPTLAADGSQPDVLFWNDFGRRGGENDYMAAFGQLGMVEGVDFDTYTTMGPSSGVSNGLGSAIHHGANVNQITNYHCLLYTAGNLSSYLLSDGTEGTSTDDKANDTGLLEAWHAEGGGRYAAYFGDNIVSGNTPSAATATYVATVMAAQLLDADVRDNIDGLTAPEVVPVAAGFTTDYVAYGGCLAINQFDAIDALSGTSVVGHRFAKAAGGLYDGAGDPAASVIHDRGVAPDRIVDVTFPYGMIYVRDNVNTATGPLSARTNLLGELFAFFGGHGSGNPATDVPSAKTKISLSAYPNPFNPSTTIKMNMPVKGDASVKLYNLRGQLVKTLYSGELAAGIRDFVWEGRDNNGATVASGVYMVEAVGSGQRVIQKIALVK